jgi:hypothetical protein
MKILFDLGSPAPLRHALVGHTVATAFEQGWSNLQNGDLIRVAEADGFNALIPALKLLGEADNVRREREKKSGRKVVTSVNNRALSQAETNA